MDFISEIKTKLHTPIKPFNLLFWMYFVGVVIIIGGIGVWCIIPSSLKDCDITMISESLATYFIATLASSYVEFDLSNTLKHKKTFKVLSFLLFCFSLFLFYLSFEIDNWISLIPSVLGALIALLIWYLANANSEKFYEDFAEQMIDETHDTHSKGWDQ